jgi:hypothetical protein
LSLGFTNQVFTLAQMADAVHQALAVGYGVNPRDMEEPMESVALIICETANLPMIDVLAGLQRLADWRDWHHDHPV